MHSYKACMSLPLKVTLVSDIKGRKGVERFSLLVGVPGRGGAAQNKKKSKGIWGNVLHLTIKSSYQKTTIKRTKFCLSV